MSFIKKNKNVSIPTVFVTLGIILIVVILFSFLSPYFLSFKNLLNIFQYSAITGVIAVGMTFVIVSGGIDISVGSVVTLVGMVLSMIMPDSGHVFELILVAAVIGIICGFINGFLVTKLRIVPFAVTLGTMEIFKGMAFLTTKGVNTPFMNTDFLVIGRGFIVGGIPISFLIMFGMILIGAFILTLTPFGKKVFAIGANSISSSLSGINVSRVRWLSYVICGFCAAIAGVISVSQQGAGLTHAGEGAELPAITAAVLGGASLSGGAGNMLGTFAGVILLNMVTNGLNLLGVSSYWQMVAQGAILVFAVTADVVRRKHKK